MGKTSRISEEGGRGVKISEQDKKEGKKNKREYKGGRMERALYEIIGGGVDNRILRRELRGI